MRKISASVLDGMLMCLFWFEFPVAGLVLFVLGALLSEFLVFWSLKGFCLYSGFC
jgi:hypothetical protein